MTNKIPITKNNKYDLKERTYYLGERVINLIQSVKVNEYNRNIVSQLSRSGTSIGANYMEADGAESRKNFEHKISICRKEAKETMYWVRLFSKVHIGRNSECNIILKESQELVFIFSAIIKSSKNK